jgi:hypothetical protein
MALVSPVLRENDDNNLFYVGKHRSF